jgi:hypothetical protein
MSVDGSMSYHEGRVLANGDGEAMVIVRDITDQKRAEEARQNTVLLKNIHSRLKNHLQLMRSFPEALEHRISISTPNPEEQTESQPQNTEVPADSRPQDAEVPADTRPQDSEVPADSRPQSSDFVDAVRSSKGD